jgi:acyl carrier protein
VLAAHAAGVLDIETAAAIVVSTNAAGDKSKGNGGMAVVRRRIQKIFASVMPRPATVAMYSTVTGTVIEGTELSDDYWFRNLSEPALIQAAIESLALAGYRVFVDISPGPGLEKQILETFRFDGVEPVVTPSMRRNQIERETLFDSLCGLYGTGAVVNWNAVNRTGRAIPLPKYRWHTRSYWVDGAHSQIKGLSKETRRVDEFRATFLGLTEGERIDRLKELVQIQVGEILGIPFGEQLKVEAGFMQLGMDSRMLAELRVSLEAATSLPLPMSALFEYPTIQSLSGYLFSLAQAYFEEMRYA